MSGYAITFSLLEWLAITGLVQTILILVYIFFRARHWRQAFIPIFYFFCLAAAFGLQFAVRLEDYAGYIRFFLWLSWAMGPPLCYLLVLQVVRLTDLPPPRHFISLLSIPAALFSAFAMTQVQGDCGAQWLHCASFFETLYLSGAMTGALCMLALWLHRDIFGDLWRLKVGREKYWLVMMLLTVNILALIVNFMRAGSHMRAQEAEALLVTMGIAFVYLATTTLFRVYPPPVQLNTNSRTRMLALSDDEKALADKIRILLEMDKVYQEHSFGRADLARETGASESAVSKVVNAAFGRSLPKLLNELRVEDAKQLLRDPDISIQVVASESGFNSLASFNRVFREVTGDTPSFYRAAHAVLKDENIIS